MRYQIKEGSSWIPLLQGMTTFFTTARCSFQPRRSTWRGARTALALVEEYHMGASNQENNVYIEHIDVLAKEVARAFATPIGTLLSLPHFQC